MENSILGKEVDGYRIEEVLGRGGMGVVYKAEDVALSRTVALKRIDPSLASDESFLRRFRSEARALARVDSSYIVSVHALRRTEVGLLIVMEYVDGGNLKDRLRKGPMDWQEAMPIIRQMLKALEHAHGAEVIHRDVKPHNIMLTEDGTVKVTDFGLAKVHRPDSEETVTQGVYGTLNYMSPEQVQGGADLDHRSDLYSLGMTVYEMLTGELPFDEDSNEFQQMRRIVEEELPRPDQLRPAIPDGLSALIMKALEKDPDDRFQSAEVMREAFEAFEEKHGVSASSSEEDVSSTKDRSSAVQRWGLRSGIAVLVLLVAVGGYVLYGRNGEGGGEPSQTSLTVSTEPVGASVYMDGRLLGVTPLQDSVTGRTAQLRIQKEGYVSVDTSVGLTAGSPVDLDMQLNPAPTPLSVATSPSEAAMYVDGDRIGVTPLNDTLRARSVRVRLEKEGFVPVDTTVRLSEMNQSRLEISLREEDVEPVEPDYGSVRLDVSPSGTVYVDGEARTAGQSIQVPAGTHRLRFQHPTHGSKDTTLTVSANETYELTCYFTHRVVVRSNPTWASVYLNGENTGEDTAYNTELGPGTYRISARIAVDRNQGQVTGGTYRLRVGEERLAPQKFEGNVREVTIEPTFAPETHVIDFRTSDAGS